MARSGRISKSLLAGMVMAASVLVGVAPADAQGTATVLLSGLSSPKGLATAPGDSLLIGQGAFGPPGPILRHMVDSGDTVEITEPVNVTDVAPGRGSGWALSEGTLYRFDRRGSLTPVADIPAYQETDPDPEDLEDFPTESNPYGLAALPSGDALVADAAGNDLLRITPRGQITTVARFDVEIVSTDHLPPDFGLPPQMPTESVPTGVTVGSDGFVYVGELKGFPFRPGSSKVWKIDPDAEGALCSTTTPGPSCSRAAGGFTAIQDIAIDLANRSLYVYEFAAGGILEFESGFGTGEFPPAVLLKVTGANERTELVAGELSEPGGVAVDGNGDVYVTDGLFSEGRLLQIQE
ncbi:hypothetical protein BH24ACT1_BH24ACT1_03620 [soil metagenome]